MIYPVPIKSANEGKAVGASSFFVSGDFENVVKRVFSDYKIPLENGGFPIKITVKRSERTTYIKELSRLTDEKYFITVKSDGILLEASCEKGVFRAANTLSKMITSGELFEGETEDYPLFLKRGYIEGFYGAPWEQEKRLSVMKLMAQNGMNTYYYAPKDDIYHREKWSEPYPEKELSKIKELFNFASGNYFDFYWCIGPGLSYHYTLKEHFDLLMKKFSQLYSIGIKKFGLLLDDIPNKFQFSDDEEAFGDIVYAHTDLVNKTYRALKAMDGEIELTVCPTQYSGKGDEFYISEFGTSAPRDVSLFWTGEEICSRVLTCREALKLQDTAKHAPLFWDNFPVNDCEMFQEMHLNYIDGRDKKLYLCCEGIISNVMEYAECSKIPLLTFCDYLWNPECYDKEASLKNAHKTVLKDKAELFAYFADHLYASCLTMYSSPKMSAMFSEFWFLYNHGEKEKALSLLSAYRKKSEECSEMLGDYTEPLFSELRKWSAKYKKCCRLLGLIEKTVSDPGGDNKKELKTVLDDYNADAVVLTGFCLREAANRALAL